MKIAKAMKFGGQLVEAIDCDYNSYEELGLLCPVCGNLVYLAKGQTKTSKLGKVFQVPPHFKHFKEHALIAENCELRVKQYSQKEIAKAQNAARNQRLKFFQTWFWSLIDEVPLTGEGKAIKEILAIHDDLYSETSTYRERMNGMYDVLKFIMNLRKKEMVDEFFSCLVSDSMRILADSVHGKHQAIRLLQDLKADLDLKLHRQICGEAVDFALTKKNRHNLTRLFFSSVMSCTDTSSDDPMAMFNLNPETIHIHCYSAIATICMVAWAKEFDLKVNQATR